MTTTMDEVDVPGADVQPAPPPRRSRPGQFLRGRDADPAWVRPALLGLLAATAALYLIGLGASGWANSFYAAAVQAGSHSWKAFFFGSSDASNFITVDKPPASLWVMDVSARLFGVNGWSLLVPQALEGVAAVGVLYLAVRRWFSPAGALLAGAVMALTPVAALMFRFNNPDALLVLLLVLGAYATVRALENGSTRWLVLAGVFVGFGFLAKMMQTFVVVPAFALVYLVAAPPDLWRRVRQLLLAGVAMIAAAGWWVAIVALVPASSRPYVGGSPNNSILNLIFSYNGFGRLTGNETGSVGGGGPGRGAGGSRWGSTGLLRMFNGEMGGQISWLIPAALLILVAGLWVTRRMPRTDRTRAALLLWGGWLVVTAATFSFAKGIIHPYYTVALAPAVGALIGFGATSLWRQRHQWFSRAVLAVALAGTAVWAYILLDRSAGWHPSLRYAILIVGLVAALAILATPYVGRRLAAGVAVAGLVAALAGPAAYAVDTASTTHSGAIPSAGPSSGFGGGGPRGFAGRGGFPRGLIPQGGQIPGGFGGGGFPGGAVPGGAVPGTGTGAPGGIIGGRAGGGLGSFLNASKPAAALVTTLKAGAKGYTWVAAAVSSNAAAGVQLATGDPVMAIGGFNGTDPTPTLAQFQRYVSEGKIHYFLGGGGRGFGGGSTTSTSSQITTWVTSHFTATTVGGTTLYDLTNPA